MKWKLGIENHSESTTLAAEKDGCTDNPMRVTIDNHDPRRAHTTVWFADQCFVKEMQDGEDGAECSFVIQSEHAELLVILPVPLATLLVSFEAAHREKLVADELDATMRRLKAQVSTPPLKVVRNGD